MPTMNPIEHTNIAGLKITTHAFNTIVVGSGAAGLNAAEYLHRHGQKNVALVTEGVKMGTSRNTGSDKQTYYKLTLCGSDGDSVRKTAQTLFSGGAMDGDIALAEAAGSAQCFYRLIDMGVPFPENSCGEYVGYKTDHDPLKRGTSCGPLTSKFMTEKLLDAVKERNITVFDKHQVIEILTAPGENGGKKCVGVLTLNLGEIDDPEKRYVIFSATNVVYATGGEAAMYEQCVYPQSQTGATGNAFRAGVHGKNLTESQYGITSVKFRWNLSGTYQQVLPRYISRDRNGGDEQEFLTPYFDSPTQLLTAIFLKGYQWPFDPRKVAGGGSSLIDILVYNEIVNKGRKVFLDYTRNPSPAEKNGKMDFSILSGEVSEYLENSGALLETPILRLAYMNPAAIDLYKTHAIDLEKDLLEIAVSAQHNNGGLEGDKWWQSRLDGFFPIGEVNGTHGVYRPGGTALNSGQVGGMRAAKYIVQQKRDDPMPAATLAELCGELLTKTVEFSENALADNAPAFDVDAAIKELQQRMSRYGAHIRSAKGAQIALDEAKSLLDRLDDPLTIGGPGKLRDLHRLRDLAVCQYVYLFAIQDYINRGGASRGSYLVYDQNGEKPAEDLPEEFRFRLENDGQCGEIQEVAFENGNCRATWRPVRPIPPADDWFETVWKRYLSGEVFRE